jgi:hypothetical protein
MLATPQETWGFVAPAPTLPTPEVLYTATRFSGFRDRVLQAAANAVPPDESGGYLVPPKFSDFFKDPQYGPSLPPKLTGDIELNGWLELQQQTRDQIERAKSAQAGTTEMTAAFRRVYDNPLPSLYATDFRSFYFKKARLSLELALQALESRGDVRTAAREIRALMEMFQDDKEKP